MKKMISILTLVALVSCSLMQGKTDLGYISYGQRAPASSVNISRIETLLAVDKFHYYIGEYINSFGKHIDEQSVSRLKSITPEQVLEKYSSDQRIRDAQKYDDLIYEIVKEGRESLPLAKTKYKWGYNFFKNKLNDGFSVLDTKLKTTDQSQVTNLLPDVEENIPDIPFNAQELTLDADHYISNRTTRAVFWEAVESGRDIDFHLENSREFLKNLSQNGAQVVKEIRPFANNYNKIYIVQYPSESTYRYAITSIGGEDRLKHLVMQFGLSKFNGAELKSKMRIYGDIEDTHRYMENELTGIFKHMPQADRVIIGQKGAIEKTLDIMWKTRALKTLYDDDPDAVLNEISKKMRDEVKKLFSDADYKEYDIFKNKKEIETAFKKLEKRISDSGMMPKDFKLYDYDNYVISMSDFAFKNKKGEDVVWRVVANSWGDEIAPLAKALKNSGHRHITYIGTAGAFPDKGYKVGDLVIPTHARYQGVKKPLKGTALTVAGAKVGGAVDHVFSPYVETQQWLEESSQHADFVEVETGYLRKVLDSDDFDFRAYLLISDVLGNEGETLATASSAKRRNALNKLIYAIMDRDSLGIPKSVDIDYSDMGKIRNLVQETIPNKGKAFQYYVASSLRNSGVSTKTEVNSFVNSVDNFSDNYFTKRIVDTSEVTSFLLRKIEEDSSLPKISIDSEFSAGKWHPKNDKLGIIIHANSEEEEVRYKAILEEFSSHINRINNWSTIQVVRGPPQSGYITIPKYITRDSDYLVQLYSQSAFRQAGLDVQVTYTGNIKYNFLPTDRSSEVCQDGKFCNLAFFAPDETTKNLLTDLDTVEKFKSLTGMNARKKFEELVPKFNLRLKARGDSADFVSSIVVNKNAQLSDGKLAEIVPSFDESKGLVINVNFTAEGWKNPLVILEELMHLGQIVTFEGFFQHPVFWAEMALNSEYGSAKSRMFMAKAEVNAMDELENFFLSNSIENENLQKYIDARRIHAGKILKTWKKAERAEKKFRKGISARWKDLQKELEAKDLKLDDYIETNNRKKVAELIDAYMPWETMEPTEIAAWTRWIKSIKSPSSSDSDKMITFRGIGSDLVRETDDGHFLMAKLLTKNQGSYTRRLRSFKTYFKKKLGPMGRDEIPLDVQSLAASFKGHSHEPNGSPFLSTSVLDVANFFANDGGGTGSRIAAIKVDKSRNLVNLVSDYNELEQMMPLIVFPDELIYMSEVGESQTSIKSKVKEIIDRNLKTSELSREGNSKLKIEATKEWWNTVNPKGVTSANTTKTCKDVIKFFLENR